MKHVAFILYLLFGGLFLCLSAREADSLVLNRMFSYQNTYQNHVDTFSTNCYTKYHFVTHKRNLGLWLIPSMYSIAKGEREYVSEQLSHVKFLNFNDIRAKQKLFFTTVPHSSKPFSVLNDFSVPQLYSVTLYGDHILSPFHSDNRIYYKYSVLRSGIRQAIVEFRPLLGDNTQLVSGKAVVLLSTGRILDVDLQGEYDMIRFHTTINSGIERKNKYSKLPLTCKTDINFRFLGNHLSSSFVSVYNLPDYSLNSNVSDRESLEKIRPMDLTEREKTVINHYDSLESSKKPDAAVKDTTTKILTFNTLREIGWDIGTYLVRSHQGGDEKMSYNLSPILQPQYVNYSHRHGLSYKMKLAAVYALDENRIFDFSPTLGYNFKIKQFFFQLPFRFVYNKSKNNYAELTWNNGNRIANSSVVDELKRAGDELTEQEEYEFTMFDDYRLHFLNSMQITSWMRVDGGLVYHVRKAVNKEYLRKYDLPEEYRSLAPNVSVVFLPFAKGPTFNLNYEHALKFNAFQLSYSRWEAAASQIFRLPRTQLLNMRIGGGFYSSRYNNYFMSYSNFSENYLPGGWDDNDAIFAVTE